MAPPDRPNPLSVREIFLEAVGQPTASEREAYLDRSCAGDPARRAQVEALLRSHRQDSFLESPAAVLETVRVAAPALPLTEKPGMRIGRYRLLEQVGEGGFGVVFLAEQEEPVRRLVALKIIKLGMDTRQVIARFEAERQALALMDHPNIAKVLDAGATEGGRPYFVMEMVQGVPVTQFCAEQNLAVKDRLDLFVSICQAIQHAHHKGVIHRDIKPSNILVALEQGKPSPKVIDFGIAKAINQRLTERTLFTEFAQMIGTPAYMSPEQAEMTTPDIDTRSDVYSLGVLLYELLTGTTPIPDERLRGAGYGELVRLIREEEPERPSTRITRALSKVEIPATRPVPGGAGLPSEPSHAREFLRSLRGDLDWVVMKALEKDRRRRYDTPGELAADLGRHLRHEPVNAAGPSWTYRLGKFARRHRSVLIVSVLFLLLLITGTAVSTWQAIRAMRARQAAVQAEAAEREQRLAAEGQRTAAQRHAYAANLQLAQADWNNNNLARLRGILRATEDYPERSFEWFYWQRMSHGERMTLRGHLDTVTSVAISPNSQRIASGSSDRSAIIWDASSGQLLARLEGHADWVWLVAFSPDGKRLATASGDQTVRLWEVATGEALLTLNGHVSGVPSVAFSPDGTRLVTGSKDRTVKIWAAISGQELHTLRGHAHEVWAVAWSPDGRYLASGGKDHSIKVWDATTGQERLTLQGHRDWVTSLAFSKQGLLASASGDRTARVWDPQTGGQLLALEGHSDWVTSIGFAPDGERVLTTSLDGLVKVWSASTGRELNNYKGHSRAVQSASFAPDGGSLVSGSWDGTLKVWNATAEAEGSLKGHTNEVTSLRFAPDGRRLVSGSWDRTVRIWDLAARRELMQMAGHADWVWAVAFSPDGRWIASGSADHTGKLWDASTGRELRTLRGHSGSINALAIAPRGDRVATGSSDQTIKLWDSATGHEQVTLTAHRDEVLAVAFAPDGQTLASGSKDGEMHLWNADTGRERMVVRGHTSAVNAIAFSPAGGQFASGSGDGMIKVWDRATGHELLTVRGHEDAVNALVYSPDGHRIISGSADHSVRVWDAESGQELLRLPGRAAQVRSVAISPDAGRLAAADIDHGIGIGEAASRTEVADWEKETRAAEARLENLRRSWQQRTSRPSNLGTNDPGVPKAWLIAGPFPMPADPSRSGLDVEFLPGESALQPQRGSGSESSEGKMGWREGRFADGVIDFQKFFGQAHPRSAAYAVTYVWVERAQNDLLLKVGSDDQARIWLNGQLVYEERSGREFEVDNDTAAGIHLREGRNVVVFKVVNEGSAWKGTLRFTNREGYPVPGIAVRINQSQ